MSDVYYHLINSNKPVNITISSEYNDTDYTRIVILNSLKDFNVDDYDKNEDTVVKFIDCEHIFTFGDVHAYTHDRNRVYGKHNSKTNLFSWAIAFGNGCASNLGHGPAVTFGGGNARSRNQSISFGDSHAIIGTTLTYNKYLKPDLNNDEHKFCMEYFNILKKLDKLSYAETYGVGRAASNNILVVDRLIDHNHRSILSKRHGYSEKDNEWRHPGNPPYLHIDDIYLKVNLGIGTGASASNISSKEIKKEDKFIEPIHTNGNLVKDLLNKYNLSALNENILGCNYKLFKYEYTAEAIRC